MVEGAIDRFEGSQGWIGQKKPYTYLYALISSVATDG